MRQRIALIAAMAFTALVAAAGPDGRPDFSGSWRSIAITKGPLVESAVEIQQTESSFSLRKTLGGPSTNVSVYPLGTVAKTKMGRHTVSRSARWEGSRLILEETGPGNAPWRKSTELQIVSLSEDGRTMSILFHGSGDRDSKSDYRVDYERVKLQ